MAEVTEEIRNLVARIFKTEAWPGRSFLDHAARLSAEFVVDSQTAQKQPKCYDCGSPHGDARWIETNLPNDTWAQISPTGDEGGLLCIACISARCRKIGLEDVAVMLCGESPLRQVSVDEAFDRGFKCAVASQEQPQS